MIYIYDKRIGETMTEVIKRFSEENSIKEKVAYAGRLDPLAYGKIIILTGNDIYKKDDYCNKSKIYETWMIEGIMTDTYDIMGLICTTPVAPVAPIAPVAPVAPVSPVSPVSPVGPVGISYKQYYPPYSSIPIRHGNMRKPLWYYTKNKITIPDELLPYKQVTLHNSTKLDEKYISSNELLDIILDRISKVITGDFRQDDIIKQWKQVLSTNSTYKISKWRFEISSGGYIRYIANRMSNTCYDINRITYV
jgi:tRNA U55 pseudouridine synthase TruB